MAAGAKRKPKPRPSVARAEIKVMIEKVMGR
jgi:hypothetical protein